MDDFITDIEAATTPEIQDFGETGLHKLLVKLVIGGKMKVFRMLITRRDPSTADILKCVHANLMDILEKNLKELGV